MDGFKWSLLYSCDCRGINLNICLGSSEARVLEELVLVPFSFLSKELAHWACSHQETGLNHS